jgi:hypothetical protein
MIKSNGSQLFSCNSGTDIGTNSYLCLYALDCNNKVYGLPNLNLCIQLQIENGRRNLKSLMFIDVSINDSSLSY